MNKLLVILVLFGVFGLVSADGGAFAEGKKLIESNVSCDKLTEHQLEEIGEYLMEQMHPGTSHEAMHNMMGFKEGDPEEEKFHVNLAKAMYCNPTDPSVRGMMGGSMMGGGMIGNNMMGGNWRNNGMMSSYNQPNLFGWTLTDILVLILLIGLIVLVYLNIWTKLKETHTKKVSK